MGRGGYPGRESRHLLVTLSHSWASLAFQIDISEDDIDDGFRRLFAQLAGEVSGPQVPVMCPALMPKKGQSLSSRRLPFKQGAETKNKQNKSKEELRT